MLHQLPANLPAISGFDVVSAEITIGNGFVRIFVTDHCPDIMELVADALHGFRSEEPRAVKLTLATGKVINFVYQQVDNGSRAWVER